MNPFRNLSALVLATALAGAASAQSAPMGTKSTAFKGVEVNGGTISASREMGCVVLKLSSDFKVPNTPAPHWQVVDSSGNVYLLKQLKIAGMKTNRQIALPAYVKDVAKVQIWCSFAEVLLGEASFARPVANR